MIRAVLVFLVFSFSAQAEDWSRIETRLHQLRVNEISGALFQELALNMLKGPVDLEIQIRAAKEVAERMAPTVDAETAAALKEGAADFERKIRLALATPLIRVQLDKS